MFGQKSKLDAEKSVGMFFDQRLHIYGP
jgi:hypothetical protein